MKRKGATGVVSRRSKRIKEKHSGEIQSPLLTLPAELRNRIYEYVLKQQGRVMITTEFRFPTLLQTSRQLRHETQPIFLEANCFSITIRDLDARLCHAWAAVTRRHFEGASVDKEQIVLIIDSGHNWNNLLEWCERIHGGLPTYLFDDSADVSYPLDAVIVAAHKKALTYKDLRLSWDGCKKALEDLYDVAKAYDSRWKNESG